MAVRGGVAERHLYRQLVADPSVLAVVLGSQDGPPDLLVSLASGRTVTVECKNASQMTYANGTPEVETQKTRASKGDPKSRLYDPGQFDVVAASMYGPVGRWEFRFKRSDRLERDKTFGDRLAPIQRVDSSGRPAARRDSGLSRLLDACLAPAAEPGRRSRVLGSVVRGVACVGGSIAIDMEALADLPWDGAIGRSVRLDQQIFNSVESTRL